ncbi:LysR substrate-binding domain-containing protein [Pseudomonas tohonis]|nr:LysR substrate-binding domain-containing protein [Pseudomonas tohonis]
MSDYGNYRLPSLDAMQAFVAAARLGSFERAAEELSLTGSALRKRVSGLEQLLGVQLLNRRDGTLSLTAQGQVYLEQIRPVMTQLVAIPMHSRLVQRRQRLAISCPPTFARQILIPRLAEHCLAHPGVDLEIQVTAPLNGAGNGTSDVDIFGGSPEGSCALPLLDEWLQPLAAPQLLARLSVPGSAPDFSRLPLLRSPLEPWRPWLAAAGLSLPEPDQGPALLDLGMMLEAAANGQGVVLARPSLARPWLADGQLVPLGRVRSRPSYHYEAVLLKASPAADAFLVWLRSICSEAVTQSQAQMNELLAE